MFPASRRALPTEFVLLTSEDDASELVEQSPAFQRLAVVMRDEASVHRSSDHRRQFLDHRYACLYRDGARRRRGDAGYLLLLSGVRLHHGGRLSCNALRRMQNGISAVVVGNFQVALEDALPWLRSGLQVRGRCPAHAARADAVGAQPPASVDVWRTPSIFPSATTRTPIGCSGVSMAKPSSAAFI
jgi:hypothetical protein